MNLTDQQLDNLEFTKELIKRAESGIHTEFQFIHNLNELTAVRKVKWAQKQLVKGLTKAAEESMNTYLKSIEQNKSNIGILISYKKLKFCLEYYKAEIKILQNIINEYIYYMHDLHLIKTLLFINRPIDDEIDWRYKK